MTAGVDLVDLPAAGRRFTARRRVRLGDAAPAGRLRLDAVARYLQDVADDDATDAGLGRRLAWVVRRTIVEVRRFPVLREQLELTTVCTGIGARWAERRTSIVGERGGRVEAVALWVLLDGASGRPTRLPPRFAEVYGPSASGRVVGARLAHPDPPDGDGAARPFPLRAADIDVAGHVNNAVYWAVLEDQLSGASPATPLRAEVEHRQALEPGAEPRVLVDGASLDQPAGVRLWVLFSRRAAAQVEVAASARAILLSGSTA